MYKVQYFDTMFMNDWKKSYNCGEEYETIEFAEALINLKGTKTAQYRIVNGKGIVIKVIGCPVRPGSNQEEMVKALSKPVSSTVPKPKVPECLPTYSGRKFR